jgi:hypothetical protein
VGLGLLVGLGNAQSIQGNGAGDQRTATSGRSQRGSGTAGWRCQFWTGTTE